MFLRIQLAHDSIELRNCAQRTKGRECLWVEGGQAKSLGLHMSTVYENRRL